MAERTKTTIQIAKQLSRIFEMPQDQFESIVKLMKMDCNPVMQEFGAWLEEMRGGECQKRI